MNNVVKRHANDVYPKKKILFIASNPATLKGFPVGFFAEELTRPLFEFIRIGYEVELASPRGGKLTFDFISDPEDENTQFPNDLITIGFNHHKEFGKLMENTKSIENININDYDAVCVVGGGAPLVTFKDDVKLQELIAEFYEEGKVVATICHGSSLLLWSRLRNGELLANGKTWTGFSDAEEKINDDAFGMKINDYTIETEARKNPDTTYEAAGPFEQFAIRDGRLITGQQQQSSAMVAQFMIEALSETQSI